MLIVYTKTGCPWCAEVRTFLGEEGIPYEERVVSDNPQYMEELFRKSGQNKTPALDLNGEILGDTDRDAVEKFLKERGVLRRG